MRATHSILLALGLTFGAATGALPSSAAAAEPSAERGEARRFAVVRVEIREADGAIHRAPPRVRAWGEPVAVDVEGRHHHRVEVTPTAGGRAQIVYRRDDRLVTQQVVPAEGPATLHSGEGTRVVVRLTATTARVHTR